MKKHIYLILLSIGIVCAETLCEVKDSLNNTVFDVSDDGAAIMNLGDTLMVISTKEIKAVIDDTKALSRKFSVSTTSAKKGQYTDLFDVSLGSATMRESGGVRYTDFSPENIFLGLNAGVSSVSSGGNIFIGNNSGASNESGGSNVFLGDQAGFNNISGYNNVFIGLEAGYSNLDKNANTYVGYRAGTSATGFGNTYVGHASGYFSTTGDQNLYYGIYSGTYSNGGYNNCYFGYNAASNNKDGHSNCVFGHHAGLGIEPTSTNYSDN